MLFLDAADDKLIAALQVHRVAAIRCAPTAATIAQGIERERQMLYDLREHGAPRHRHHRHAARSSCANTIRALFARGNERRRAWPVTVYSFGFKHGAPTDADLVMDVRFLPNPYYDPELRSLTGLDAPVRDFVLYREETVEFVKRWRALLDCVMPGYVAEGKQQLAIAVGLHGRSASKRGSCRVHG